MFKYLTTKLGFVKFPFCIIRHDSNYFSSEITFVAFFKFCMNLIAVINTALMFEMAH